MPCQEVYRIVIEVKRGVRALERASKNIRIQEEKIASAEGKRHLSRVKFERGMANNLDVIQAEEQVRSAKTALLNAIVEHITGEYNLRVALGTLADKPDVM